MKNNHKDNKFSTNNDKSKKVKKILKIIGDSLFYSLVGFALTFSIWNGIDRHTGFKAPFFGTRSSVIVSESMAFANPENTYLTNEMERIYKFDVIRTKNYKSYDEIALYDVVSYYSPNNDVLICHRVIDKYQNENGKYLVLRGDSNNIDDEPIEYSLVRGKVVSVNHHGGKLLFFLQSPYFYIALFGTGFFVFLGMFIFTFEKKEKSKNNVVTNKAGEESKNELSSDENIIKDNNEKSNK